MKSNDSFLLMLMLFVGFASGSALPQSVTTMVAGRVIGWPGGNVPSFEVVLVSDGAPCAVLKTLALADGSFSKTPDKIYGYLILRSQMSCS